MAKRFYAVYVGDNCDDGYGSSVKREAIKLANAKKRDHANDGKRIAIGVIDPKDDFCLDTIVIRDGWYYDGQEENEAQLKGMDY